MLEQVAAGIKRSIGYVSKRVRVFEDPALREAVVQRGLAVSTAEELLAFEPEQRARAVGRAVAERWDQTMARATVARMETANVELALVADADEIIEDQSTNGVQISKRSHTPADLGGGRPRGFTQAVRDFHRMILAVRLEDLSQGDRTALRSLFRDLVMLARATANQQQPVFPPLPSMPSPRANRLSSSRSTRR